MLPTWWWSNTQPPDHKSDVHAIFTDQSFNYTLTNDIVSFEQLGPGSQIDLFKF